MDPVRAHFQSRRGEHRGPDNCRVSARCAESYFVERIQPAVPRPRDSPYYSKYDNRDNRDDDDAGSQTDNWPVPSDSNNQCPDDTDDD